MGRQARDEDLSDLLQPGVAGSMGEATSLIGEVAHPGDASEPSSNTGTWRSRPRREEAQQREDRNIAMATQQLLHKRIKGNFRERFSSGPPRERNDGERRLPGRMMQRQGSTLDIGDY